MSISTPLLAPTTLRPMPQVYSPLAAATYLTWSAIIWTALFMEDQSAAAVAAAPTLYTQPIGERLQVGTYCIGKDVDVNLFGHPEIRY